MAERTWPAGWESLRSGQGCPSCAEGRAEETDWGVRYVAGQVSDAYLMRSGPLPGYSIVAFRSRHVADPTELSTDELSAWWDDIRTAVRAINLVYAPCHINYQILGNSVPHVRAHLIPRYVDDPAPMRRLRDQHWDGASRLADDELSHQLPALREAVSRNDDW